MFSFRALSYSPQLPKHYQRDNIPYGVAGTSATIKSMQKMVSKVNAETIQSMQNHVASGKRDMRVRKLAGELLRRCPQKDYECYSRQFYLFCRDNIHYAWDPVNVELVEHPDVVLDTGIADCDSIVVLLAALHEQVGIPGRYVTIKADPKQPGEFSHVYFQALIPAMNGQPSRWVSMDPTMKNGVQHQWGWEPPGNYPKKYWSASTDPMASDGKDASIMGLESGMYGLGEGAIPGIIETDIIQGPGGEYREIDDDAGYEGAATQVNYALDQSFGWPDQDQDTALALDESFGNPSLGGLGCCGGAKAHTGCGCSACVDTREQEPGGAGIPSHIVMNGMGDGEEDVDPMMAATVMSVYNGEAAKEYKKVKSLHDKNQSDLANRLREIQTMRPGPEKERALEIYQRAQQDFIKANENLKKFVENYNIVRREIIGWMKAATLNQWSPDIPQLSGFRGLGAGPAILLPMAGIAVIIIAVGYALNALASAISAARGQANATRGYLDQLANAIKQGGGVVREGSNLVRSLSIAALVGGGLYVAYQLFKGRRSSPSSAPQFELKSVQGSVK